MKYIKKHIRFGKKKQSKYVFLIASIVFSFLLGRESVHIRLPNPSKNLYYSDSSVVIDNSLPINNVINHLFYEDRNDKVYRCGNSMIYHPKIRHASFKRCKSIVSELTIEKAKELGMRHCKCSN